MKRNRLAVARCTLLLWSVPGTWQPLQAQVQTNRAAERETEIARLLNELDLKSARRSSPASRVQDVRQFRQAMERDFSVAVSARPGATPRREAILNHALHYLDGQRPFSGRDPALAKELTDAYQLVGVLSEPLYRDLAATAFQDAAATLTTVAQGDPEQGPYRERWLFLAGRLRGLGESVPAFDSPRNTLAPRAAAPQGDPPPPAPSAELERARSRLVTVTAKAKTAEEIYYDLRQTAQRTGYSLHPNTIEAFNLMQAALGEAQRQLDAGRADAANEQFDSAETYAKRVLKAGGQ